MAVQQRFLSAMVEQVGRGGKPALNTDSIRGLVSMHVHEAERHNQTLPRTITHTIPGLCDEVDYLRALVEGGDDLRGRLERAIKRLEERRDKTFHPREEVRLAGKIEGVKLALSYMDDARR